MSAKKRAKPTDAEREEADGDLLATYCVEESDFGDNLEVGCRSVVTLSASPRHASERRPRLLHTRDLAELKAWIGVPDEAARNRCLAENEHRREMKALCRMCDESERADEDVTGFRARVAKSDGVGVKSDSIRAYTRSYLYGDSRLVKEAKPVLERYFGDFTISLWMFPDILVKSGSVLAIGPGANTLLARNIDIEQGGQILGVGSLTTRALGHVRKVLPLNLHPEMLHTYVLKTAFREVN